MQRGENTGSSRPRGQTDQKGRSLGSSGPQNTSPLHRAAGTRWPTEWGRPQTATRGPAKGRTRRPAESCGAPAKGVRTAGVPSALPADTCLAPCTNRLFLGGRWATFTVASLGSSWSVISAASSERPLPAGDRCRRVPVFTRPWAGDHGDLRRTVTPVTQEPAGNAGWLSQTDGKRRAAPRGNERDD